MNGQVPRDIIEYQTCSPTSPDVELEVAAAASSCHSLVDKAGRRAARRRGLLGAVRPGAHLRQPLRVLLHLPAAQGHAPQPLPEGRRLPAVVPLRQLHDPHPLHRGSTWNGCSTERLSPLLSRSTPPTPTSAPACCATAAAPPACAGCGPLLDDGIEVHGQIVVCPGVNDGAVLEDTLAGVLDRFPELATVAAVPLGVSRYTDRAGDAPPHAGGGARRDRHRRGVAGASSVAALGRRLVFAADEYYLLAGRPFPPRRPTRASPSTRTASAWRAPSRPRSPAATPARSGAAGFFACVEGAPAEGYRAPGPSLRPVRSAPPAGPVTDHHRELRRRGPRARGRRRPLGRAWSSASRTASSGETSPLPASSSAPTCPAPSPMQPAGRRYLLPDVCLSKGVFLDGLAPDDLPRPSRSCPPPTGPRSAGHRPRRPRRRGRRRPR